METEVFHQIRKRDKLPPAEVTFSSIRRIVTLLVSGKIYFRVALVLGFVAGTDFHRIRGMCPLHVSSHID